ncbi:hypothetical protein [Saccharothrix deserti]|uniref:hypothetical protein n=1 Tax=Saccharothrix deserti TaxID=2593674 RepID=UPI00131CF498|nr:hypothetical protein [Saccharothrix deserti]
MAARGEAQADVEVSTLVVPAWRLRWRAPELALVLGERAVALASARRDEVDRLRAEALVVFASNRMGRGVRTADRALDALKAAESESEHETAWRLRVELADSARSVGAPLTGFAAVRPVLEADNVPPGLRATALVQASECLVSVGRGAALSQALDEADHLYQADPVLDHDTTLLHRGLLRAAAAGQHRRWGDLQAAIAACREGLGMLDRLKEAESDNGQVRGRLTVELVCALLDLNKPGEASEVGTPLLERPVRAPSASTTGWLRVALATRVHLPAGRVDQARDLLRDAADSAERHQLETLQAESLLALAHVHEVAGNLTEALANLRTAHAAERRRARAVYAVRARLAAEFSGIHRPPTGGLHDELASLLRTGTPAVPPPPEAGLAPEVKQQLRQWRPVQMHRNEGVRVKRSRRAAEDMTVEGISAARAHAADRWRLVQPFGETEGEPEPGGRRRAPDPEPSQPPPTQGRPEHARSGQARSLPPLAQPPTPPPGAPLAPHPTSTPHPGTEAGSAPFPTATPATTTPATATPATDSQMAGAGAGSGFSSTHQVPGGSPVGHPVGAGLGEGGFGIAQQDTSAQVGGHAGSAGPGDGGLGGAQQGFAPSTGSHAGSAGLSGDTSTSAHQTPAVPAGGAGLGGAFGAGPASGTGFGSDTSGSAQQDSAPLAGGPAGGAGLGAGEFGGAQQGAGASGGGVDAGGAGVGGFGGAHSNVVGRAFGGFAAGSGRGIGADQFGGAPELSGAAPGDPGENSSGSEPGGVALGGAESGEASGAGNETGERSVSAAGLIAAAGAVRSGRRRAAREAAEDESERSPGDAGSDPNVLDALKAAGLLDPQRAGGRRRAPDADEEAAVSEPTPPAQAEPEPVQWRVEAPQRLRAEAEEPPPIDMFDSPTMVQPAVRDDVPPVGLGAAFVKGPLIPTARVPEPPDFPLPPVPDFGLSLPDFSAMASTSTSADVAETEAAGARPVFPAPEVESAPGNASAAPVGEPMQANESAPEDRSVPEPTPEPDQVPGVPEPDQVPPVPLPDPVPSNPSNPSPEAAQTPPSQFGPTGFLSAADVEHDDTPAVDPAADAAADLAADPADPHKEPFVTAVVVGGKTIDLPAIVEPTPPAPDSPSATRASRRHKSDLSLAELLAEALVAYEDARREDEAAGRVDEDTVPITPVGGAAPESDTETTTPIQRVDPPPRFDTWTLPES